MLNNEVFTVLKRWESDGEMTLEMARVIEQNFDSLIESELHQVDDLLADAKAEAAFARLTLLISLLNAGVSKLPSIIRRLEKWVNRIKSTLNALAKKLGANGFSIGIAVPVGVSIDLSFPIT